MTSEIKVNEKKDGVIIATQGLDIDITIRPSEPYRRKITIKLVRSRLSEYIEDLTISEKAEMIIIKPKTFLGKDIFTSILSIVVEMGGEYISEGKKSRFTIPKT